MKEITLTQGKVALVDDEDYDWLMQWGWFAAFRDGIWNAQRRGRAGEPRTVYMHREVMQNEAKLVDHADRDGLNNQKSNLRPASKAQNRQNSAKGAGTSSRFKGVSFKKATGRWVASIRTERILYHLGYFPTEEEAARKYDEWARRWFGEFARLNFQDAA